MKIHQSLVSHLYSHIHTNIRWTELSKIYLKIDKSDSMKLSDLLSFIFSGLSHNVIVLYHKWKFNSPHMQVLKTKKT